MAPPNRRGEFTKLMNVYDKPAWQKTAVVSFDLEVWDVRPKQNAITQIGIRVDHMHKPCTKTKFYRIYEHRNKQNRYCMTNATNFAFTQDQQGKSWLWLSRQSDIKRMLDAVLAQLEVGVDNVVLAGWGMYNDLRWLSNGAGWTPPQNITVVDLQPAFMYCHGLYQQPSLMNALISIGETVPEDQLHNAGNDAWWTGEILMYIWDRIPQESDSTNTNDDWHIPYRLSIPA